ncbi:MAG: efflux RND transporter periplasmic adaptor subunit [Patescibacteria group bacterium]
MQDQQSILDADDDIQHKKNDEELDYSEYEKAIFDQSLEQAKKAVAVSELKYKNANAEIAAAYAKVASELRDYQENSSLIIAPSAGIISDVALAPGFIIAASSTTSNTSGATIVSAQTIGNISDPNGHLIATVSLTEMDIIYVKSNQKVSLVLDVYPDKTFTGKVLSVNTNGSSSSGVTSYPVTIILDPVTVEIYPHMGVTVEIITKISDSAILVPSSSVKSSNDGSNYLEILSNNAPQQITVTVGDSNNTQTQILSGLNEGDVVITGTTVAQTTTNRTTPSPFGNTRGVFNVGGGGR